MSEKITAAAIRRTVGLKRRHSRRGQLDWTFLCNVRDLLPQQAERALASIEWVFSTGRLPGTEHLILRRMTVWQMTDMLADLLAADIPMGQTPEWVRRYVHP